MLAISGNTTGIQKGIFHSKALPFITDMEHHFRQTGVAAASCPNHFAVLASASRPAPLIPGQNPVFKTSPEKTDPHIRILAGFLGSGWGKLGGENNLGSRAFSGLWARCKSAVYWQTERYNPPVFICIKTDGFKGFPGYRYIKRSPNWAYFLLCLLSWYSIFKGNAIKFRPQKRQRNWRLLLFISFFSPLPDVYIMFNR
jgi:hypothetical protein